MPQKKGKSRLVDQKGQWVSTTPASVKKKQSKEWAKLEKMLQEKKKK